MIDRYCARYARPPEAVTLDIDDTVDVVHGHQQLVLFNAHYDERCFLPIHVDDTATSRPVAMLLRPGKTPSGPEVRGHVLRLVHHTRTHWPKTRLTIRSNGHYGRLELMAWCEANVVHYIFGLPAHGADPPGRGRRRRCPGASCRVPGTGSAALRRDNLRHQVLALRTTGGGQDGRTSGEPRPSQFFSSC